MVESCLRKWTRAAAREGGEASWEYTPKRPPWWKVEAPRASASLVAGGVDRRSEWGDEDVVVDPLEKLKLTERGGRRGEKGYSDSREPCLVPKGKRRWREEWGNWRKRGRVGWEKIAKSGTRTTVCREYSMGEWLRPLTGPTWARAGRSPTTAGRRNSFMLPRDCHCTDPLVPRQTLQCLFFTKYCLFGSLFWPSRRKYRISTRDR